jgi:ABC-type multidrug transport system, ATPase and permease components
MNLLNNKMTYAVVRDIRARAIRQIQVIPLSYLDAHSSGDIVSRVIADADQFSDGLLLGFTQLFTGVITILATLGFMFSKNVWITLLVVCTTPVSFFVAKFIASHSYRMFREQNETRGNQTAFIEEMVGNAKVVKAFGHVMITDILRNELGFQGVITTDSLQMDAIKDNFSTRDSAKLAINAGVDCLLMPVELTDASVTSQLDSYIQDIMVSSQNRSQ